MIIIIIIIEDGKCRVCHGQNETVEHLVAGCSVLSNSEYLARHKVHHVWMLRVYEWIGIPKEVIKLIC